jgi:hypothetical protein
MKRVLFHHSLLPTPYSLLPIFIGDRILNARVPGFKSRSSVSLYVEHLFETLTSVLGGFFKDHQSVHKLFTIEQYSTKD